MNRADVLEQADIFKQRNEAIDEILRGEISAAHAYDQVLELLENDPHANRLKDVMAEHQQIIFYWKDQARNNGDIPNISSGVWGSVVDAFVGLSKIAGEETALKALKAGEEHGLKLYEKMLDSDSLDYRQKVYIKENCIPKQREHIQLIEALIVFH